MASNDYPFDLTDGHEVPPKIVIEDEAVTGTHQGSIYVQEGARLQLLGTHQGSLHLEPGSRAVIVGSHQGSLHVAQDAVVTVRGRQQGSTHVEAGGHVVVEPRGRLAGSLHNEGTIRNQGARGGTVSGAGVLEDLPGSSVKQPEVRDGMTVYVWR